MKYIVLCTYRHGSCFATKTLGMDTFGGTRHHITRMGDIDHIAVHYQETKVSWMDWHVANVYPTGSGPQFVQYVVRYTIDGDVLEDAMMHGFKPFRKTVAKAGEFVILPCYKCWHLFFPSSFYYVKGNHILRDLREIGWASVPRVRFY